MKVKVQRWLTAGMAALGAVFVLFMTPSASAAVPATITHQGRLYNAKGAPLTEKLDVIFAIYADEGGTTELWKEARAVSFEEGYFSVALGEDTPFGAGVFDGSVRYLGIKVGDDPEMTPRAAVRSVPYAMLANDVSGDINPHSISVQGFGVVVNENGEW
ncbi:MAG TPA: collagen-like protein, partial [Polyangiaceae bacterium]|nr:collagen-like protein [Polyangiaceae bacterium]